MTAVEWLLKEIPDLGSYIPVGVSLELHAKFQQALQMEKEQIIEAGNSVDEFPNSRPDRISFGEQYYNETYGKK